MANLQGLSDKADALEYKQMQELGDLVIHRSAINKLADGEWSDGTEFKMAGPAPALMGEDHRLPGMPEKPSLIDFFNFRFAPFK
jgi:hypothetical protein